MNNVVLVGRLSRDPDVRFSPSGMAVARFTVAVDRRGRKDSGDENQQTADFISCVAFGKTGEFIEKYFTKGKLIALSGRIQTGSYTNKEGQKVYTTDVVAENVEFVGSKNEGGGGSYSGQSNGGGQAPQRSGGSQGLPEGFEQITDDDMPF